MLGPGSSKREMDVPSPKQNGGPVVGRASWYPYYAGFSPAFAREVLKQIAAPKRAVIMDPWNGGGTTTQVSLDMGFRTIGFDINPVVVMVARARTLFPSARAALRSDIDYVTARARAYRSRQCHGEDALCAWLDRAAVLAVRRVERAIRERFSKEPVESIGDTSVPAPNEAAFCFTVLFRTLRRLLVSLRTSNPTWVKRPKPRRRPTFSASTFINVFEDCATQMLAALADEQSPRPRKSTRSHARIEIASSDRIPLRDGSVDVVITSPPYCTRIDYAVTASVELAVFGYDPDIGLRRLRDQMIGTSTIRRQSPKRRREWGSRCLSLLKAIENHESKASGSYYLKTHVQYFDDLYRSLEEINRCLRPPGHCILVLQDSFYKDIHNDLPAIVIGMSRALGWTLHARRDFPVARSMAGVNPHSRRYLARKSTTESVLWLTASRSLEK